MLIRRVGLGRRRAVETFLGFWAEERNVDGATGSSQRLIGERSGGVLDAVGDSTALIVDCQMGTDDGWGHRGQDSSEKYSGSSSPSLFYAVDHRP
jgi:hypothetical protein